jgi:hypothetical protein
MIDVVEILQHWHAGRPKLVLSASLGVDVKTVRKYVAPAEAAGIAPGDGLVLDRAGWAARVAEWFPELSDARARSSTWPVLEVHRELIQAMLATNTLATVHQRLRDEHDVQVGVTSLRRYAWRAFPERHGGPEPHGAASGGAARTGSPDRLWLPGSLAGPIGRADPAGVGVRGRVGLLPAHVRAAGAEHGPGLVGGRARGCVGVLRRDPGPAGDRQSEDRRDQTGSV